MLAKEGIDYLKKVPAEEPVFILRARDITSPAAITSWAIALEGLAKEERRKNPSLPQVPDAMMDKARQALDVDKPEFIKYQKEHGAKFPD